MRTKCKQFCELLLTSRIVLDSVVHYTTGLAKYQKEGIANAHWIVILIDYNGGIIRSNMSVC